MGLRSHQSELQRSITLFYVASYGLNYFSVPYLPQPNVKDGIENMQIRVNGFLVFVVK